MNGTALDHILRIASLTAMAISSAGCRPPADSDALDRASTASLPAPTTSVELQPIDAEGLSAFIDRHRGKVVLIDFWATWCQPCVEGYPHTQRLSETYADSDVVVAAVALDGASVRAEIESFIAARQARFANFMARNGDDLMRAMDEFEIQTGTLPTLKLYDRTGLLHRTFGDGDPEPIRFEEIEVTIRALLAAEKKAS